MKELDTENLISALMLYVSCVTIDFPTPKKLAVERYMRTVLRSLTRIELELACKFCKTARSLQPDLAFKVDQASKGYDRFMAKRGKA